MLCRLSEVANACGFAGGGGNGDAMGAADQLDADPDDGGGGEVGRDPRRRGRGQGRPRRPQGPHLLHRPALPFLRQDQESRLHPAGVAPFQVSYRSIASS